MNGDAQRITADVRGEIDGSQLVDEIGIDDREIAWRKAFTGFEAADERRLEASAPIVEPALDEAVEAFYDNLQSQEETLEIFGRSTKTVDDLKRTQREYLTRLFEGQYDRSYFESRARIGKIHDLLRLGPKIYLGAYAVFYEHLIEAVVDDLQSRLDETEPRASTAAADREVDDSLSPAEALDELAAFTLSMLKVTSLDQQVAMDTYIHSYNRRIETELDRQRAVADDVARNVAETRTATDDIAERSETVSRLAREQADQIEHITGEVASMSATVEEIASTAEEVAATSEEAETRAAEGREAAVEAIELMETIDESTADVADDVAQLETRIDEVDAIVDLIDDIATQTNLLALNASIEAANAGEAGQGFAVVANEVKSLAEASQDHVGEIERVVDGIKTDTADTVESLETTTERIDRGLEQVNEAMETLQAIARAVGEASEGIRGVSDATDDQAVSTEKVASMVDELLDQAEEVATEVERVANANDEQADRVEAISSTVTRLRDE